MTSTIQLLHGWVPPELRPFMDRVRASAEERRRRTGHAAPEWLRRRTWGQPRDCLVVRDRNGTTNPDCTCGTWLLPGQTPGSTASHADDCPRR